MTPTPTGSEKLYTHDVVAGYEFADVYLAPDGRRLMKDEILAALNGQSVRSKKCSEHPDWEAQTRHCLAALATIAMGDKLGSQWQAIAEQAIGDCAKMPKVATALVPAGEGTPRRTWAPGEVCVHGSLGRQCDVCERDDEIKELKAQLATATARAESAERVVEAVAPIAELIELVENRAMACDGPVTPTFQAMERGERAAFENRLGNLIHAYRALRLSRDGGKGAKA